jgi:hypothetical protein
MDSVSDQNRTLMANLNAIFNAATADRTLMAETLDNFTAMESLSNARQHTILSEMASQMTSGRPAPPPPPAVCGKCHGPIVDHPFKFRGVDYCCVQCCHDAGDRSRCRIGDDCGCTGFAIKRRQLRNHRGLMRAMWSVISEYELEDELIEAWDPLQDTSLAILDSDSEMDQGSDEEDPMQTQANELSNVDKLVQLSRNMVELAEVRRDSNRARGSNQDA